MNGGFSPACCTLSTLIADKPRNDKEMFKTVDELLEAYPEWKRPEDGKWDEVHWKDLMKTATPKGLKAKLCYNVDILVKLIEAELFKLLSFRNIIKHILSIVEPKGNKKLILELTAALSGMPATFITGGGMTLATQRVIHLYEKEGDVTCLKRRRRPPGEEEAPPTKRTYYDTSSSPSSASSVLSTHALLSFPYSIGAYASREAAANAAVCAADALTGGLLSACKLPLLTSTSSTTLPSLPHCPSGDSVVPRYDFPGGGGLSSFLSSAVPALDSGSSSSSGSLSAVPGLPSTSVAAGGVPQSSSESRASPLQPSYVYNSILAGVKGVTTISDCYASNGRSGVGYAKGFTSKGLHEAASVALRAMAANGNHSGLTVVKPELREGEELEEMYRCSQILAGMIGEVR